jgi:hypothetical protein
MQPSLQSNAVVQALVACRARRELRGTPNDTPEARQRVKQSLWRMLEARMASWDPGSQTMAQWALHVLDGATTAATATTAAAQHAA